MGTTSASEPERRRGRPPRTDAQRLEHRRRLVDAVVRAVRREGPEVPVEEMAAEAGVSKPVLYDEFGDKLGIAEAVAQVVGDGVSQRIIDDLAASGSRDVADAVPLLIRSIVELTADEPELYTFFVRTFRSSDKGILDNPLVRVVHARVTPLIAALEPRLTAEERNVLTDGVFGFVFASVDSWNASRVPDRERFVSMITGALRGGLRASVEGAGGI